MEIAIDKKELVGLVRKAQKGEIVLPQFQRNFVWSRDDIRDLLVSVTKGYFIGSFLLIRVDRENLPFQPRTIEGVELRLEELTPEWMVLDGQQRLTSLHYAFTAPQINVKGTKYPYRFYLDLNKLSNGHVDEAIWSERYDYCDEYETDEYQFTNKVIPFTRILEWENWKRSYSKWLLKNKGNEELSKFIGEIEPRWSSWIDNIRKKYIPTIEIPKVKSEDEEGIGEVCSIFEKLNSTGVPLSVFDLLTARLYKDKIDLHKLWEETITEHDLINTFSDGEPDLYGVFILRVVSMMRGLDAKGSTIVKLKPENFVDDWKKASLYFEKALQRITSTNPDGFGAFHQKWVPYLTMIPVLATLLWNIEINKRDHKAYELVKKWYWASVFLERYSGSVESTSYKDYSDLIKIFNNVQFKSEVFIEAENQIIGNPNFTVSDVSRINSIYKGIINLIVLEGARDFEKSDSIEFHELDDHHIFPQAFLRKVKTSDGKSKYDNDIINSILNKTLISSDTNRKISKSPPSKYIQRLIPPDKKDEIFKKHLIFGSALKELESDNYDGFLVEREKIIIEKIKDKLKV